MRSRVALAAVLAVLAATVACKREPPAPEPTPPPRETAPTLDLALADAAVHADAAAPQGALHRPYNVVLILIDSLRADMPWTGYPREIAPRLSELAKTWTLYPRAYSLSSYTAKSVAPMLAGKYPGEMAHSAKFFTHWPEENVFLGEIAQKAGIRTLAGHGHGYFMKEVSGLQQGFDDYQLLPGTFLDTTGVHDINSDRLNAQAKAMLQKPENVAQEGGKRFFAYFHFLDPHFSYVKHKDHPDFGNQPRDLYDNEVHFTDRYVGDLVDFVEAQPWGKDTAVVITADHGEGFGERGRNRHAYDVWESLVRVPLFVHVPGAPARRIEESRSAIDLAPTIADLMSFGEGAGFRGQSLVPEVMGAPAEARPVLVDLPRADLMDRKRAFVDGKYKLIAFGDNTRYELFDVTIDPREEKDLVKSDPDTFAAMKQKYLDFIAPIPNKAVSSSEALLGAPGGQRY